MAWRLFNTLQLWLFQGLGWRLWSLLLWLLLLHIACVRLPALVLLVLLLWELLLLHVLLPPCVVGAATQACEDRPSLGVLLLLLEVWPLLLLGCAAGPQPPATSKATTTRLHPGLLLSLTPVGPVGHRIPSGWWGWAAAQGPTQATASRVLLPALFLCQIIQAHVELLIYVTHA